MTRQHSTDDTMYYVAYSRVSTDEQRNGISIDFQLDRIAQWADKQTGNWVCLETFEEDYTGFEYERPEMNVIWKLAKEKKINAVVVLRRNRFSRGEAASIILEQHFKANGVRLFSVEEGEFTPGSKNIILSAVERAQSEAEAESNKKNMREKRRAYVEQGAVPSQGYSRYGYTKVGKRGATHYEILEEEAAIVRLIITMYTAKYTIQSIADELNTSGVPSPSNATWNRRAIRNILDYADFYHGVMTAYKHAHRDDAPTPFSITVPAILDDETYNSFVYAREISKGRILPTRGENRVLLLIGRITCSCGYKFHKQYSPSGGRIGKKYNYYYRCNSTRHKYAPACTIRYINADIIEPIVWRFIEGLLLDVRATVARYKQQQRDNQSVLDNATAHITVIEQVLEELSEEKNKVLTLFRKGYITEDRLEADMLSIDRQFETLSIERERWKVVLQEINVSDTQLRRLESIAQNIKHRIHDISFEEKVDTLDRLKVKVDVAVENTLLVLYISLLGAKADKIRLDSADYTPAGKHVIRTTTTLIFRLTATRML